MKLSHRSISKILCILIIIVSIMMFVVANSPIVSDYHRGIFHTISVGIFINFVVEFIGLF